MSDFDPKAYVKSNAAVVAKADGFNPKAYVEANKPKRASPGESAMRGAAQGATFGFADEGVALIGAALQSMRSDIDFGTAYEGWKSAIRRADKKAQADNPITYGAGEIAGAIGTSVAGPAALGAKAGKAAGGIRGVVSKGLNPALAGTGKGRIAAAAASGALTGAGRSEADPTKGDAETTRFLIDTGSSALVGGATQGVINKIAPPAQKAWEAAPERLRQTAEERAAKAAIGNNKKAYDEAVGKGVLRERGRELLDEKVVTFGSSAATIAKRAKEKAEETGKAIGRLLAGLDEAGDAAQAVSGKSIADGIRKRAAEIESPNARSAVDNLLRQADEFEAKGAIGLVEANRLKGTYRYKFGDPSSMAIGQSNVNKVKSIISDELEAAVGRMSKTAPAKAQEAASAVVKTGTGTAFNVAKKADEIAEAVIKASGGEISEAESKILADSIRKEFAAATSGAGKGAAAKEGTGGLADYVRLKGRYGTFTAAAKDAKDRAVREAKNRTASLSDNIWGAMGAGAFGLKGALLGVANNVIRKRGSSAAAVTADALANVIEKTPQALGPFAPALKEAAQRGSLIGTHVFLLNNDKNYRQRMEAIDRRLERSK